MLTSQELYDVKGGIGKWAVLTVAGTLVTFIIGVIDGHIKLK